MEILAIPLPYSIWLIATITTSVVMEVFNTVHSAILKRRASFRMMITTIRIIKWRNLTAKIATYGEKDV